MHGPEPPPALRLYSLRENANIKHGSPPPHAPSLKLVAFRHRLNLYLHSGPSGGDYSEGGKVFTYKVPVDEFMYIGRTDLTLRER